MGNRKAFTDYVLKALAKYPGRNNAANIAATKAMLEGMTDKEFEAYVEDIENDRATIRYCKPNFKSHEHDYKIIEAFEPLYDYLGTPIFSRFWHTDPSTGEKGVSKFEGLLLYMPDRMLNQMIIKKRRYAKNSDAVDELTGQATGKSRASTFSAPEAIVTLGKGHRYLNLDMMKIRGGDERGYQLALEAVYNDGTYSIDKLLEHETNVTSVVIYSVLLEAMHFSNNIWKENPNVGK